MKRSVVIKRLGYEASAGWTTYGTSLAAFSLFQGIVARYEGSPASRGSGLQRRARSFDQLVVRTAGAAQIEDAGGQITVSPSRRDVIVIFQNG